MTLGNIQTAIFRNTGTDSTNYPVATMAIDLNNAAERVHSLIRKYIDNFRPTAWAGSDITTGTATPVFDALFHELVALWPSYNYTVAHALPSANGYLTQIQYLEKKLEEFYGSRNYYVFTVTIASPGVLTRRKHGLSSGDRISIVTSGALPTGLSVDTFYFVISDGLLEDDFRVSSTKDGTAINTSGTQSGTHWFFSDKQKRMSPGKDSNK